MRSLYLLIRKDFISALSSYGRSSLTFLIFFCVSAINTSFIPMAFNMTVYMLVVTLFQTEENDLVCNIRAILPVKQTQLVIARYLYTYLILIGAGVLIGVVLLVSALAGLPPIDWVMPVCLGIILSLVMASVMMPLMYRFGVSKMRAISILIYAVVVGFSFGVVPIFQFLFENISSLAVMGLIGVAAAFLLSLVSMAISVKIEQ